LASHSYSCFSRSLRSLG